MKTVGMDMSKLVFDSKPRDLYSSDTNSVVPPLGIWADKMKRTYIQVYNSLVKFRQTRYCIEGFALDSYPSVCESFPELVPLELTRADTAVIIPQAFNS
jgi:hypothetical protein